MCGTHFRIGLCPIPGLPLRERVEGGFRSDDFLSTKIVVLFLLRSFSFFGAKTLFVFATHKKNVFGMVHAWVGKKLLNALGPQFLENPNILEVLHYR